MREPQTLTQDRKQELDNAAEKAANYTETFCDECKELEVDPLGSTTGVNTRYNKLINSLTTEVMKEQNLEPVCQNEIRMEFVEYFYKRFDELVEHKRVSNHCECTYCYEQKKDGSMKHVPILVTKDNGIMTKTRQEWR